MSQNSPYILELNLFAPQRLVRLGIMSSAENKRYAILARQPDGARDVIILAFEKEKLQKLIHKSKDEGLTPDEAYDNKFNRNVLKEALDEVCGFNVPQFTANANHALRFLDNEIIAVPAVTSEQSVAVCEVKGATPSYVPTAFMGRSERFYQVLRLGNYRRDGRIVPN